MREAGLREASKSTQAAKAKGEAGEAKVHRAANNYFALPPRHYNPPSFPRGVQCPAATKRKKIIAMAKI